MVQELFVRARLVHLRAAGDDERVHRLVPATHQLLLLLHATDSALSVTAVEDVEAARTGAALDGS